MPLIMLKCNGCGGAVSLDTEKNIGFCPYCGARFIRETPVNNYTMNVTNNVTNTFKDANVTVVNEDNEKKIEAANTFLQLGQYVTAGRKFSEVIDSNPSDYRGWWGVALAMFNQLRKESPISLPNEGEPEHSLRCYEARCQSIDDYFNKALFMCKDNCIKQRINSNYNTYIVERNKVISNYRKRKNDKEAEYTEQNNTKQKKRSAAWLITFLVIYIPVVLIINILADNFWGSAMLGLVVAGILRYCWFYWFYY